MRILILHQNMYERLRYDVAIDHALHEVVYAGKAEFISNIPAHISGLRFVLDPDKDTVEQLTAWMSTQPAFDRIITRYEGYILPAATLRERFGITGMTPDEALRFRDKVVMKKTLEAKGIRVPRFVSLSDKPTSVPWRGKTVLKPRDEGASQGIIVFPTPEEAFEHIKQRQSAPDGETFINKFQVEEYLEGEIWHVDGYLYEGQPVAIKASRYVGTALAFEHGAPLGSVQYDNAALEKWTVECLQALGVPNVTFHLETIVTSEGPVFLEVAARGGGGYIVDIFEAALGIHLHKLDIATQVEGSLATRFAGLQTSKSKYAFFLFPGHQYKGARCNIEVDQEWLNDRRVVSYKMIAPGSEAPNNGTSYREEHLPFCGIISGDTPDDLSTWLETLFKNVTISPAHPKAKALDDSQAVALA